MNKVLYSVVVNQTPGPGSNSAQNVTNNLLDVGYPRTAVAPTGSTTLVPGTHIDKLIKSLNVATSIALSEVRKFQSLGVPCKAFVFGKVVDTGSGQTAVGANPQQQAIFTEPTEPLAPENRTPPQTAEYTLTPAEMAEKLYADVDTEAKGLKERINASNKSPFIVTNFDPDELEDVDGIADQPINP